MKKRSADALYAVAFLLLVLAVLLARPADLAEFFFGLFAPPLAEVQIGLLVLATALVAAAAWLHRRRTALVAFGVVALGVAVHRTWRELAFYGREHVTVPAGTVSLDGTLYVPREQAAKRAAVVIVHGSGPSSRDGYHFVADRLARRGYIVLNVDKRGVGRSTGQYYGDDTGRRIPLERRADDMAASLAYLRRDPRVDASAVGIFGISQAGWVFPLLAQRDSALSFAVIMSGAAVSTGEEEYFSDLANEKGDHFGRKPPPLPIDEIDRRVVRQGPSGYDPRADLSQVSTPALWLFGDWDASMPVDASARVLDSAARGGVPFAVRRFPEANHGLFVVRGPHARRLARFAPGVWDTIGTWIDAHTVRDTRHAAMAR